jgi:hypothetical protein
LFAFRGVSPRQATGTNRKSNGQQQQQQEEEEEEEHTRGKGCEGRERHATIERPTGGRDLGTL